MEQIQVGPFDVVDASVAQLVELLVPRAPRPDTPTLAYALHVGGLNLHRDAHFVETVNAADVVYADGAAVVALARLAGARTIERSPTTDLGWSVIAAFMDVRGRPPRVALIGGPPGLAEAAGDRLAADSRCETVFTSSGYKSDWSGPLAALRSATPDLVFVGLGMPLEADWCATHRKALPPALVMTAGGWFGFVVGQERRAPVWMRRTGLEWAARLAQDPRRLSGRYARGAATCAVLATRIIARRARV